MSKLDALDFVSVDQEKLKRKANEEQPSFGPRTPAVWLTLKKGTSRLVRILPPWAKEGQHAFSPYLQTFQHWDVGPSQKRSICPRKMPSSDEDCYICQQIDLLRATKNEDDAELARAIRPGQGFIYQVIDRDDEFWQPDDDAVADNPELVGRPKIKFMRLPWAGHSQVLDTYNDADYGDISHPLSGFDVKVGRQGEGYNTTYSVTPRRNPTPLFGTPEDPDADAIIDVVENQLYELDMHPFFIVDTFDKTKAKFMGLEDSSSSTGAVSSGGAPKGHLSAPGVTLAEWIMQAKNARGPMTRAEIAEAGGWQEKQIAPCYAESPDHLDKGCVGCPMNAPCARTFFEESGKYSINAPDTEASSGVVGGKNDASGGQETLPLTLTGGSDAPSTVSEMEGWLLNK